MSTKYNAPHEVLHEDVVRRAGCGDDVWQEGEPLDVDDVGEEAGLQHGGDGVTHDHSWEHAIQS